MPESRAFDAGRDAMNDLLAPVFNLLPAMWERRWWGLAVAWAVALLAGVGVLMFKERYQASATVYVDTQTTLRPLLEGLSVQPDVSQQVAMLAQTLLSRNNVIAVMEHNRLLPAGATPMQRELLIQNLRKQIHVGINGRDNIYTVSFIGHDPAKTLGVVRSIVDLFVHKSLTGNQQDTSQALDFIDSQIALYQRKLQQQQDRLQQFSKAHPGFSAQTPTDYATQQGQLETQITTLEGQLSAAQSTRDSLLAQLRQVHPSVHTEISPGGVVAAGVAAAPSPLDREIAAQQQRLDELLQRYTDAYPDVVSTRRNLARLLAQRKALESQAGAGAGAGAGNASGGVTAPQYAQSANPVYQQLQVSLTQANANAAALQAQLSVLRARLQQLGTQRAGSSGLDAEYQQLTRDYTVLNDNYQKLMQRRESAVLARNQEQSRRSDYFRIIEPPRLAPAALFPHRTFLIALALVVSAGVGVAVTYLLTLLRPTYRTARQLRENTDRAVLGTITLVLTPDAQRREQRENRLFMAAGSLLVLVYVAWTLASVLHLIH